MQGQWHWHDARGAAQQPGYHCPLGNGQVYGGATVDPYTLVSTCNNQLPIAAMPNASFPQAIKESQGDANLIGQFGVGFYSAFLVADRVTVETKSDDDEKTWRWESSAGSHQFTVHTRPHAHRQIRLETPPRTPTNTPLKHCWQPTSSTRSPHTRTPQIGEAPAPLPRGTRLTLHLKEDAYEYADDKRLQGLIKQYSEFISFPISLYTSKQERKDVVDEEATQEARKKAEEKV